MLSLIHVIKLRLLNKIIVIMPNISAGRETLERRHVMSCVMPSSVLGNLKEINGE